MKKHFSFVLLLPVMVGIALQVLSFRADGCTLWGAAGEDAGGGTIISKNRDWKPDHVQLLKINREGKYAFLGLYAEGNDQPGIKQGVNEAGLCVTSATAGSVPKDQRTAQKGTPGLMSSLLARYASCAQVLADKEKIFAHRNPSFLMIADREQVLMLEVGLQGHYAVKRVTNGLVTHCNHYLEPSLAECNLTIGESSAARLKRVTELLEAAPKPVGLPLFAEISRDRHDGVNNSLWRTGTGSRTLSSWILRNPAQGAPTLRILLANPGKSEELQTFVLDDEFWRHPPVLDPSVTTKAVLP